jgi:hypothetical protein
LPPTAWAKAMAEVKNKANAIKTLIFIIDLR